MSYRKILVPLFDSAGDETAVQQAMAIAGTFKSHVAAILARPDPAEAVRQIDPTLSPRVIHDLIDSARAATTHERARGHALLEAAGKRAGIDEKDGAPGWSIHVREGLLDAVIAQEALLSDLTVFAHPAEHASRSVWMALEAALLGSRRPLLVLPQGSAEVVGKKVVIGWDGGRAASHAVFAALPLLCHSSAVEILTIGSGTAERVLMDNLTRYLRMHGVQATQNAVNPGTMDFGYTLADAAKRAGAGLLVVGGYGHSRLREFVLGGVTRHLLANATLPIFMAH